MKKQYIFLVMIAIILYILYLIITFTYKEYKINSHIEYLTALNKEIKRKNFEITEMIEYKKSKAYKNMILKGQQSYKNTGEKVVYLTTEQKYNKFTQEATEDSTEIEETQTSFSVTDDMSIFQKWFYYIFGKDIRD